MAKKTEDISVPKVEVTGVEFVQILLGGDRVRSKNEYNQFYKKEGEINIDNIIVTSEVNIKEGNVFENSININGGDFKEEFRISGGVFENDFRILSGVFENDFRILSGVFEKFFFIEGGYFKNFFFIEGGTFKHYFRISGGNFKSDFRIINGNFNNYFFIEDGNFENYYLIEGGNFEYYFLIIGGNFKNNFRISGGVFKNYFRVINGSFKNYFWIERSEFKNNFLIEGGEFKNNFLIEGGEFKNNFLIEGGEFKNNFLIKGGNFKNDFVISGGTFKSYFMTTCGYFKNFTIEGGSFEKISILDNEKTLIEKLELGFISNCYLEINDININTIIFKGLIKSNGVVNINNQEVNTIEFNKFVNQGLLLFSNVKISKGFKVISSEGNKKVNIEIEKNTENIIEPNIKFLDSTMGKFEIKNTKISEFKLEINNTNLNNVSQYGSGKDKFFPTDVQIYNYLIKVGFKNNIDKERESKKLIIEKINNFKSYYNKNSNIYEVRNFIIQILRINEKLKDNFENIKNDLKKFENKDEKIDELIKILDELENLINENFILNVKNILDIEIKNFKNSILDLKQNNNYIEDEIIKIKNEKDINNVSEKLEILFKKVNKKQIEIEAQDMKVQTFRDLAVAARSQDDYVLYHKYHSAYQKALLVTSWRDCDLSSCISIVFNWGTNNFGKSWILAISEYLVIGLVLFCFFDYVDEKSLFNFEINKEKIVEYLSFLNPLGNLLNYEKFKEYNSSQKLILIFSQIFFVLILYQIVQAFRKFGRKL